MAAKDPVLRELFETAHRQIEDAKVQSARRHEVTHAALSRAEGRRERTQEQYEQRKRAVTTASERFVVSEKIMVDALSEMSVDMRKTRERLDEIGDDSQTHRETLFAILDRLEEMRG